MQNGYEELFDVRGGTYDEAMRRHPRARDQEFAQAVRRAAPRPGMVVADVPAGGGYLAHHLPAGCAWWGHEPCATFSGGGHSRGASVTGRPLLPLPWRDASVDAVLSIAGVHHMDDKRPLFSEMHRVTRPGGTLVLSDVARGSAEARFLDGHVGAHNSTGHAGIFLDEDTPATLERCGWAVLSTERAPFHWTFADRAAAGDFLQRLFDLRKCSARDTLAVVERDLGIDPLPGGGLGVRWALMTVTARRRH